MPQVKLPSQPTFTILYFAGASTYTALSSERLPAPLPLSKLFPTLESRYPGITSKVLSSCAVSVNLEYVDMDEVDGEIQEQLGEGAAGEGNSTTDIIIQPGDEVGIIPPVSSG